MPIEYIKIKNFLSHKDTMIPFSPGVNDLIGDSDTGKSAVMKALDWCIFNNPSGDEYVSWWAGKEPTSVEIGIDGRKVIRKRTKSSNTYQIDKEEPYHAFGQGVPEDVQKIFNIQSINIHRQPDAHFLISQTSGKVAQYINKMANLEKMQKSVDEANLQVKRKKQSINGLEAELEGKSQEEKEFKWINKADGYLTGLKNLQSKINSTRATKAKISASIHKIKMNQDLLKDRDWVKIAGKKLNLYLGIDKKRSLKSRQISLIVDAINRIKAAQSRLKRLPGPEVKRKFKIMFDLNYNIDKKTKKYNAILDLVEQIEANKKRCTRFKLQLKTAQDNFHKLMPSRCPLCEKG